MTQKILFIGGTGIISSACAKKLVEDGTKLTLLCRGKSDREPPKGVEILQADIRAPSTVESVLGGRRFDAVVDWVAFTPAHVEADIALFQGKTAQYVFISSASVYQTPLRALPITESTPLSNPFWRYSRDKIACEELLNRAYRDRSFPMTIVRPSHTYDCRTLPFHGGYSVVDRMRRGKAVVVHGDGTSLWVLTHHADFARGFNGLLGDTQALGEAFHITSDELLTGNQIHEIVAEAAGVEPKLAHVPSESIARLDPEWGSSLLGDKAHSVIFDNTKIKRRVPGFFVRTPFRRGAREIIDWFDEDPKRRSTDAHFDALCERLVAISERTD